MIPYENLARLNMPFNIEFKSAFSDVLDKGNFILGHQLELFEKEFAEYNSIKYCVGVSNGLDAIILALKALNLPTDSEVIVPANTYVATILAIIACNLKPILVEPDIATYNIDAEKIECKITAKTKVLLVVHLYGKMCNMDRILEIKNKYNLFLVEDCAQAHGAMFKNKLAGTFGELGAFSFYPTKNLGALGDAGGIICNNEGYKNTLMQLRNYGSNRKYYNDIIGYNNRMDEMQAAFLRIKLRHLNSMNQHRNRLAKLYSDNLSTEYTLPQKDDNYYDVFHIFNIRHIDRNNLQKYLLENEIGTVIHYPVPPHKQNALKDVFFDEEYQITNVIHDTTLSLPCSVCHTEDEILCVIDITNKYVK